MSAPHVGVVTALGRPEYDLLVEAGQSLRQLAETLGGPGELQWVVCCDSDPYGSFDPATVHTILASLGLDVEVLSTGRRSGPGPARNAALAKIRAPYLITLDSDDTVVPAGMAALLHTLAANPGAGWAAGRCYHVGPNCELLWVGPPDPWPPGPVAAGQFWDFKIREGGLPFLCPAAVARTAAIRACGGWPAVPRSRAEDTALWAVLTSRWPGMWAAEHVYNYRRHTASITHTPGFRTLDEDLPAIGRMVHAGTTRIQ